MAAKLYPPVIEGTIPAFCGTTLVVPFSLNRAVSKNEIAGFVIKIKTVQGSVLLGTVKQTDPDCYDLDSLMQVEFNISDIAFTVGQHYKIQMAFIGTTGQIGYYSTVGVIKCTTMPKIEISGLVSGAINNHVYYYTGLYSQANQDTSEKLYSSRFILYNANNEIVKDSGDILHNITQDDNAYEAYEDFSLAMDLESNASYYLQFFVTTTNKLTVSTKKYRIMQKKSIVPDLKAKLSANLCFEDGYIDLYLVGEKDAAGSEQIAIGSFVVCRAASNENFVWNKVCEFSLQSQTPSRFLWRDYTIEQGVTYQYSVQQYNDYGLYSDRILSPTITADFEDAFLYDGERQLKIRYNPKISSFKTDLLESKTDTIGSKHPFIFRNGNVYYKEFPISGLISYQMDDNHLFMNWGQLGLKGISFDFTSDNLLAERIFKMEVLEWLNNGEEKLFRSPTEGNYIVRLMNNSLAPTDSLGRMLHTFSSTAYEVADFNYDNLNRKGFITIANASTVQTRWSTVVISGHDDDLDAVLMNVRRYLNAGISVAFTEEQYGRILSYNYALKDFFNESTIVASYILSSITTTSDLNKISTILGVNATLNKSYSTSEYNKIKAYEEALAENFIPKASTINYILNTSVRTNEKVLQELESIVGQVTYATGRINARAAKSIFVTDMMPGTIIKLATKRAGQEDKVEEIQIGVTGSYRADFSEPVTSIIIPRKIVNDAVYITGLQGSITYSYESAAVNVFDTIKNIEIIDIPDQQWIGLQEKTYYDREQDATLYTNDLVKIIEDEKIDLVDVFSIRFEKRPLQNIYINALAEVDGNERAGVPLSKLPKGVRLVECDSVEAEFALNPEVIYERYNVERYDTDPDTGERIIVDVTPYYKIFQGQERKENTTYYVKVYTYYSDVECSFSLDLNADLDPYYVYRICNARPDYTYKEVWYEYDYIDSNMRDNYYIPVAVTEADFNKGNYQFYTRGKLYEGENRYSYNLATSFKAGVQYYLLAHGYYVNKDGKKLPLETGRLLDGLSTMVNQKIYDQHTYSNKIYINGSEMDLTETERYSIVNFKDKISSIKFDNGIICDMSYQIRNVDYNLESTNQTVASHKAAYEAFKNRLTALRMLESLKQDYELAIKDLDLDSDEYKRLSTEYRLNTELYANTLTDEYYNKGNYDFVTLETIFLEKIKSEYTAFIYQLSVALKEYEEANSIV